MGGMFTAFIGQSAKKTESLKYNKAQVSCKSYQLSIFRFRVYWERSL